MSGTQHFHFNSAGQHLDMLIDELGHDEELQQRAIKIRFDLDALHHDYTDKEQFHDE